MVRTLITVLLLSLAIHTGHQFATPVIKNTMLEAKMRKVLQQNPSKTVGPLTREIMKFVEEKKIPLKKHQLLIECSEDERHATIAAHYSTEVTFLFYTHHYDFFPATDVTAKRSLQASASNFKKRSKKKS